MNTANFFAICYGDIFDYPLTKKELSFWSINNKTNPGIRFNKIEINRCIINIGGYYCIKGREKIIQLRNTRNKIALKKINTAKRVAMIISGLPFVQFVGITGALSMKNSDANDDIDLLIISQKNRIWTTRVFAVLVTEMLRIRRRPMDKKIKNKICLNMFLGENNLTTPRAKRNLYTAHEVLQVFPLVNKNSSYKKFISANVWAGGYLPVAFKAINKNINPAGARKKYNNVLIMILNFFADLLDMFLYGAQLLYMKPRKTNETVEKNRIFFHPKNPENQIIYEFNKRLNTNVRP